MQVFHSFPDAVGFGQAQGRKDLVPGIIAVYFQSAGIGQTGLLGQHGELVELESQYGLNLPGQFRGIFPQGYCFPGVSKTGLQPVFTPQGKLPHP